MMRNQAGKNMEVSSLLASFTSAMRFYIHNWKRKIINIITDL